MNPSGPLPQAGFGPRGRPELEPAPCEAARPAQTDARSPRTGERPSGVVLCGGKSARMGRDKARVELDGRTLIERALGVLDGMCGAVALACGRAPRYAELGRVLVLDRVEDGGPLAGIEAALAAAPAGHVVVLAVDLPRVDTAFLEGLLACARAEDLDACLARSPSGLEPLCGVYHTRLQPRIQALLARGERKVTLALTAELDGGALPRWSTIEIDADHGATKNVNTPADLEAARAPREALELQRKAAS